MRNKRCVVNFATTGREPYLDGTTRMIRSIAHMGLETDMLIFSPELEDEEYEYDRGNIKIVNGMPHSKHGVCKPHKEAPYQFKSFIIQHAREKGYEQVAWLDSSIVALRNPEHHFKLAKETGVVLYDNPGCLESSYTADNCLEGMGCSVEVAKTFFQIDAAVMIFDFTTKRANTIFDDYMDHCLRPELLRGDGGSTRADYTDHRHDQSIMSYIARMKHYVLPLNHGSWCYFHEFAKGFFWPTWAKTGITLATFEQITNMLEFKKIGM